MNRSNLVRQLAENLRHLPYRDVEAGVSNLLAQISDALASGERIEVRGFGSFSTSFWPTCIKRNPKPGERVVAPPKYVVRFKPGRELRRRVNAAYHNDTAQVQSTVVGSESSR